jgi:hypothetical protein
MDQDPDLTSGGGAKAWPRHDGKKESSNVQAGWLRDVGVVGVGVDVNVVTHRQMPKREGAQVF